MRSADGCIRIAPMRMHGTSTGARLNTRPSSSRRAAAPAPIAQIIDARRHPLGCCFSGFKQHFARGQNFSYDLADMGRYYRDYVDLMAHVDAVLPGRVHRVFYESMIENTETEVRRLLDYCGLPFEDQCLRFYETDRAVRTPSSEQVRQPIFKDAMEHWRHYEEWLGPREHAPGSGLGDHPARAGC